MTETTNDRHTRITNELYEMHGWALADAEHSEESGAKWQADLDRKRAKVLMEIIQKFRRCRKE